MSYQFIDGNTHAINKHLREWDRQESIAEAIEQEETRIFNDDAELLAVARDMADDDTLGEALHRAALRSLEVQREI
jgi:hypothetical protein